MIDPIYEMQFPAQALIDQYPPEVYDRNKRIVFDLSCPDDAVHSGTISASRWSQLPLPKTTVRSSTSPIFEKHEGYFDYLYEPKVKTHWYLNFAHSDLFRFYGGPLFAQDEMQVAEHPALGSLRHALLDHELDPFTVEDAKATPILITGVERRCVVATDPNPNEQRPNGLYGNNFAQASEEAIRRATKILSPPTVSNILAMEAPSYGEGTYSRSEIEFILSTAYTGFRVAVVESHRKASSRLPVVIHTGYWGCGAYGGNRELMPLLQMIAALWAGVDELAFHTGGDIAGMDSSEDAFSKLFPANAEVYTEDLVAAITSRNYAWGVGDGN